MRLFLFCAVALALGSALSFDEDSSELVDQEDLSLADSMMPDDADLSDVVASADDEEDNVPEVEEDLAVDDEVPDDMAVGDEVSDEMEAPVDFSEIDDEDLAVTKGKTFTGRLHSRNGVPARTYQFSIVKTDKRSGSYSSAMVAGCKKYGMKPVCDHPSYCKTDKKSVYLGQQYHIAYPPQRNNMAYNAKGWKKIKDNWKGLCSYTNKGNGVYALCNVPSNTHSWKKLNQGYHSFMCAKVMKTHVKRFFASLGAKNGVKARSYEFAVVTAQQYSGSYAQAMINDCGKLGMKPVCDHPSYCKKDTKSIYLGQTYHIAHHGHRHTASYFPSGWSKIKNNWVGLCAYTAKASGNGKNVLCNHPTNSHSWQNLGSAYHDFVCALTVPKSFTKAHYTKAHKTYTAKTSYHYKEMLKYLKLAKATDALAAKSTKSYAAFKNKVTSDTKKYKKASADASTQKAKAQVYWKLYKEHKLKWEKAKLAVHHNGKTWYYFKEMTKYAKMRDSHKALAKKYQGLYEAAHKKYVYHWGQHTSAAVHLKK